MLRKPSKRCPLPSLMKDDRTCMDFIYEMGKLETALLAAIADSVEARQSQNQLIKKALENEEMEQTKLLLQSGRILLWQMTNQVEEAVGFGSSDKPDDL